MNTWRACVKWSIVIVGRKSLEAAELGNEEADVGSCLLVEESTI